MCVKLNNYLKNILILYNNHKKKFPLEKIIVSLNTKYFYYIYFFVINLFFNYFIKINLCIGMYILLIYEFEIIILIIIIIFKSYTFI